ncbi:hypothetical protein EKO27_g7241 [Xylaria grammica]|uniref:Major facilitator superfamily (MFS) profile domain-containing protein n=1 Tax=Xylaria grammica TaxID=363999 RepID=A0A439D0F9_9PEZI|nr:hypothetical protein EKO27_g7241 [Xylaria grammica]
MSSFYNNVVIAFAALGSFSYGYCASVFGSVIGLPGWYVYFDLPMTGEEGYAEKTTPVIATANGVISAGGGVGSLFAMWSADALGRRASIQLGAFFSLLGGALQGSAVNLPMFQAGRFIAGVGIGLLVVVCPMYMSELAPVERRGWLVGHHAIFLVIGYTFAGWIAYACYFSPEHLLQFAWRFPMSFQTFPPLVLLAGSIWLPRSPRWLMSHGHEKEALRVLHRLRQPTASGREEANLEFNQIQEQLALEKQNLEASGGNIWQLLWTKRSYRKRMILGFLTQFGAEFGGPLVITNYLVILVQSLGQTGSKPLLVTALYLTTAGFIWNPLGSWLHDRIPSRRGMLIVGMICNVITISLLVAIFATYQNTDNQSGKIAGIAVIFIYLALEGTMIDTTMYLYVAEIFPMELRSIGMGFSLFGQFAATIILLQTTPIGLNNVGWRYFLLLIVSSAVFAPVIWYWWPETAGLTIEQVARAFGDEVTQTSSTVVMTSVESEQVENSDEHPRAKYLE